MEIILPGQSKTRSLIVSIHDVSPRFEAEVDQLREILAAEVDEARLALLVIPDHWQQSRIVAGSPFARRLRLWAEQGNEIFLHGWFHRDTTNHAGRMNRFRATCMTAREGEFLGLDRTTAHCRLRDGRDLLQDIIGRPVAGFVAPAWLYGRGAIEALAELQFPLAEDHLKVWHPPTGQVLARGPVINWASRSQNRIRASVAFAAAARRLLNNLPRVRLAVHPGDTGVADLRLSIARTLSHFAKRRRTGNYAELLGQ